MHFYIRMKKIAPLVFLLFPAISFAQINFGSPSAAAMGGAVTSTVKDWEAIEINPANLGWNTNHPFSVSIANIGINLQDNGVSYTSLKQSLLPGLDSLFSSKTMSPADRQAMYNAEISPGGLNLSASVTWAAFSFSIPKIGGFAINLTDELFLHAQLSPSAGQAISNMLVSDSLELIALAKQSPDIFINSPTAILSGSNAGGYHYRELNMDYGRKILTIQVHSNGTGGASYQSSEFQDTAKASLTVSNPIIIYGGIGFKPVWGLADYNGYVTGTENVEEGTYVYSNQNYWRNITQNILTANGRGYGIDLGLSISYKKWKLGASAIDLGKITWHNNSFVNSTVEFPAVDSAAEVIKNSAKAFQYFTTRGVGNDYTTQLPSRFRSGISYQLTRGIALSGDFVKPLNTVEGNLLYPYVAVGAHINIFRIMSVSVGYAAQKEFPNAVPVGAFFNLVGGLEMFVATDDLIAYLNPNNGRVLSVEAGIKLFGF